MAHHPLREDKTCLNCRHVVEKRYCPNCGQENTSTRKTFYELFVHFFEDLTHYENSFWKTIRNLLTRPAALTKEYLSGKRMSYLAPVRLYIFISFMTFLIGGLLPISEKEEDDEPDAAKTERVVNNEEGLPVLKDTLNAEEDDKEETGFNFMMGNYKSVRELDSAQAAMPEEDRHGYFGYKLEHRLAEIREKSVEDGDAIKTRFVDNLIHNIPKAIFMYMPFFALWLWLFHGKRRWYYFDHGIFTLHYFSFLLLTYALAHLATFGCRFLPNWLGMVLLGVVIFSIPIWWFFYFFRSHRLFYGESRTVSRLKSLALFIINMIFMSFFIWGFMLISYLNVD